MMWFTSFVVVFGLTCCLSLASKCLQASEYAHRKIVNEYDQEISQSQTADNPVAPRRRAAQPSRDTRKKKIKQSNQLSLLHQDYCNTRMDIK